MTVNCPVAESTPLTIRLASSSADIRRAQRLRWHVFYEELGATPLTGARAGLDIDAYDDLCDHLLVEHRGEVVGTYRLLRQPVACHHGGFYSADEYRIAPIVRRAAKEGRELLELGRSCVAPAFRNSATIQLLWRGIADYLAEHRIGGMFGCASFPGIDPQAHAQALSYLAHHHLAPLDQRVRAQPDKYVEMALLGRDEYDPRRAMRLLPPLIKAYLRVGAKVGDGAVIDHQFNTVDVFLYMPVELITERYSTRFAKVA
jgi:putative hemolysin